MWIEAWDSAFLISSRCCWRRWTWSNAVVLREWLPGQLPDQQHLNADSGGVGGDADFPTTNLLSQKGWGWGPVNCFTANAPGTLTLLAWGPQSFFLPIRHHSVTPRPSLEMKATTGHRPLHQHLYVVPG